MANRLAGRKEKASRLEKLRPVISSLEADLKNLSERLELASAELSASLGVLKEAEAADENLKRQRAELIGQNDPDAMERALKKALSGAEKALETARQSSASAEARLKEALANAAALQKELSRAASALEEAQPVFLDRLREAGFGSEDDYLAAVLSEPERKKIQDEAQKLKDERSRLTALTKEKSGELSDAKALELTASTAEELKTAIGELSAKASGASEESGKISGRLSDNEDLKAKRGKALEAKAKASERHERLDRLHRLIGSSEGKKFRNFAQALTFERLVYHANRQLAKMSQRYLLDQEKSKRLSLSVIDGYQASQIRPTKNLSGGETFIISLALALGLSRLAGENVRVDSLFLDEGFGTLDEDALDQALDTLQSLKREGKTIGLISHVPALTERIAAAIEVKPVAPGRSVISGPGCRSVK